MSLFLLSNLVQRSAICRSSTVRKKRRSPRASGLTNPPAVFSFRDSVSPSSRWVPRVVAMQFLSKPSCLVVTALILFIEVDVSFNQQSIRGAFAERVSDVRVHYRFSLGLIFPEPGLIIGRFMWIKYSSSLPSHHVPYSLATLTACFLNSHHRPPDVVSFCLRDDGQQDTGSTSRPVRRLSRRDGGLPVPSEPPSRLRINRASTSICVRGSFLNRRIT